MNLEDVVKQDIIRLAEECGINKVILSIFAQRSMRWFVRC